MPLAYAHSRYNKPPGAVPIQLPESSPVCDVFYGRSSEEADTYCALAVSQGACCPILGCNSGIRSSSSLLPEPSARERRLALWLAIPFAMHQPFGLA